MTRRTRTDNAITEMQADDLAARLTLDFGALYARIEPSVGRAGAYAVITKFAGEPERRLVFWTQVERLLGPTC